MVTTTPRPAAIAGVIAPKKLLNTVIRAEPSNPPIIFIPNPAIASPINIPPAKPVIPAATPTICFANSHAPTLNFANVPAMVTTIPIPAATVGVIPPKKLLRIRLRELPSNPPINFKP